MKKHNIEELIPFLNKEIRKKHFTDVPFSKCIKIETWGEYICFTLENKIILLESYPENIEVKKENKNEY